MPDFDPNSLFDIEEEEVIDVLPPENGEEETENIENDEKIEVAKVEETPIIEEVETGVDTLLNELWENLDNKKGEDKEVVLPKIIDNKLVQDIKQTSEAISNEEDIEKLEIDQEKFVLPSEKTIISPTPENELFLNVLEEKEKEDAKSNFATLLRKVIQPQMRDIDLSEYKEEANRYNEYKEEIGIPENKTAFEYFTEIVENKRDFEKNKKIKEKSYLNKLTGTDIPIGNYTLGEMIVGVGEVLYDIAAIPQNFLADKGIIDERHIVSAEDFKKKLGITNPLLDWMIQEKEDLRKEQNIWNNANYDVQGIAKNFQAGNWTAGFKQLGSGIGESAPVSLSIMMGGAVTTTGKLIVGSTPFFMGPELRELRAENPEEAEWLLATKALGLAAAETVFMSIGTGTLGRAYKQVIFKEGKKVGEQKFKEGLITMYREAFKKLGAPISALGEGIEEVATQITQNLIKGKDPFEGVPDAFLQGIGGGTLYGAPMSAVQVKAGIQEAVAINKINNALQENTNLNPSEGEQSLVNVFDPNLARELGMSIPIQNITQIPGAIDILDSQLNRQIDNGKLDIKKADEIKINFRETSQAVSQIKQSGIVEIENRTKALNLLKRKNVLQQQVDAVNDIGLNVLAKEEIKGIDEELSTIIQEEVAAFKIEREETVGMGVVPIKRTKKEEISAQEQADLNKISIDLYKESTDETTRNNAIKDIIEDNAGFFLSDKGGIDFVTNFEGYRNKNTGKFITRQEVLNEINAEIPSIINAFTQDKGANFTTYAGVALNKRLPTILESLIGAKEAATTKEMTAEELAMIPEQKTEEVIGKEFKEKESVSVNPVIEKQLADRRPDILAKTKEDIKTFIASKLGKVKEIGQKGKTAITKFTPTAVAQSLVEAAGSPKTRQILAKDIGGYNTPKYKKFIKDAIEGGLINTIPFATMKKRFGNVPGFNIEKIGRETLGPGTGIYKLSGLQEQGLIDYYISDKVSSGTRQGRYKSLVGMLAQDMAVEQFQEMKTDKDFMKDLSISLEKGGIEMTADEFVDQVEKKLDKRTKEKRSLDKTESLKDKPKTAKEAAEKAIKEIITEDNIDNFKDKDVLDKAIEYFEGIDQDFKNTLGANPIQVFIKAIKVGLKAIRLARNMGKTYLQSLKSGSQAFNKQITAKEAAKEIIKDKSLSKIQIDIYNKLLRTPGKPTARKAAGVTNEVVNDKTRPGMIKNLLIMAEKVGFNPVILSAMAGSGAIRTQVAGPTAEAKRLRQWLEKNNPKALKNKKAYWYKTIDSQGNFTGWVMASKNKKGGPAAPLNASGKPRTDLAPARNKLFYSTKSDPAFIKIYNAAKVLYMEKNEGKEPQSPKRVVANTINPDNVFSKENQERGKANVEIMDGIIEDLEFGVSEGLMSIELAAQVIENGYQSTRGFIKLAAPFVYRSDKFEYGKGDKYNKGVKYREEHNPPASTIGGMLMYAVKTGTYGNIKSWVHTNYTQTLLSKKYDEFLELNDLESAMPENTTMYKFAAADLLEGRYDGVRYAAAGIDLNSIKNMIKEGKPTMAEELVIPIKDKKDINLESIHYQNELIIESNGKPDANDKGKLKVSLPAQDQKASRAIKNSKNFNVILNNNQRSFEQKEVLENSLATQVDAQKVNKKKKGISVFDFDDTLAKTKEKVIVYAPYYGPGKMTETRMELTPAEFAERAQELENAGASFDFSQFENVIGAKKGPLADLALKRQGKFGGKDIFILTARPQTSAQGIKTFLDGIGLNIPIENITGLEDGTSQAKARWVLAKTKEGYNDFYFADDVMQNVKAVKQILDQVDVKSKVQQAIADKEITLDIEFNKIVEETTGLKAEAKYSPVRARLEGRKKDKGFFKWFGRQLTITPSAEDFMGLMYDLMGSGKQGNRHAKWIRDTLIDPYNKAEQTILSAKVTVANDFAALKKAFPSLRSSIKGNPLMDQIGVGPYTKSQAMRVYIWNKQGMEIPGLSKRDQNALVAAVEADSELNVFADEIVLIQKDKQYPAPTDNWAGGTIDSDIMSSIDKTFRRQVMTEFDENTKIIFSDKNMNKLEALYGKKWVEALQDSLRRMKSGSNRPVYQGGGARIVNEMLDWLNGSVGAVMFLNMKSGLLQLISNVNFINWGDNNIYQAAKAFASKEYWPTVMKLMNSDYLVNRRDGLKINVNEAELANAAKDGGMKGAIAYLLDKGFIITRIMDSLAIATGGATFYINRRNALLKRQNPETGKKYTKAEAEAKAFDDFYAISEESQQSSNPSKISQQQASLFGRVILAFQNVTMQYNRMTKKSIRDLYNRRKSPGQTQRESDLGNLSKIIYYTTIQNIIFNALQQALFAMLFDDEEDEKEKNKTAAVANGMLDSLLFGLGFGGAAISTVKNVLLKVMEESDKKSPDYEEAVWEIFNISPVLDSKVRKLRTTAKSFSWNMEEIKKRGWSLDNPAYLALSQLISATTNIPIDRVLRKMMNIRVAMDEETRTWQRVALMLGWSPWSLGLPYWGLQSTIDQEEKEKEKIKASYKSDIRKMKASGYKKVMAKVLKDYDPKDIIELRSPAGTVVYYAKAGKGKQAKN